jgi:hypothetical protein
MPRLDEIEYYLNGVWLLLRGKLEGLNWLDFSQRGFWRSWWSIAFCLPPLMLEWAGMRMYYLSTMPAGVSAGPSFILKLAIIDLVGWALSYLALAVAMVISGYAAFLAPMIVAVNWLNVPLQWLSIFASLALIVAPLNSDLYLSIVLMLLIVYGASYILVMRQIVGAKSLPAVAFLLAMTVASLWSSTMISDVIGF